MTLIRTSVYNSSVHSACLSSSNGGGEMWLDGPVTMEPVVFTCLGWNNVMFPSGLKSWSRKSRCSLWSTTTPSTSNWRNWTSWSAWLLKQTLPRSAQQGLTDPACVLGHGRNPLVPERMCNYHPCCPAVRHHFPCALCREELEFSPWFQWRYQVLWQLGRSFYRLWFQVKSSCQWVTARAEVGMRGLFPVREVCL